MAFSSNILTCMAMSAIFRGKINVNFVNYGILAGFIYVAILATFIASPFVALIVGTISGVLTSIMILFHEGIDYRENAFDPKGFLPVVLGSCVLASYMGVPLIITAYELELNIAKSAYNEGRHMIYTSISLGIGFVAGLIAGGLRSLFDERINFRDMNFFSSTFKIEKIAPVSR